MTIETTKTISTREQQLRIDIVRSKNLVRLPQFGNFWIKRARRAGRQGHLEIPIFWLTIILKISKNDQFSEPDLNF